MARTPILFAHYGNSYYLKHTLSQAARSNQDSDLILIGDNSNRELALRLGWKHYNLRSLSSPNRDNFNARFRWVQGINHQPVRGGQDWLRFVSERFFIIEEFMRQEDLKHVWHFGSDTMILDRFSLYAEEILSQGLECVTFSELRPTGFLSKEIIRAYCRSMIEDYKDEAFLASQQEEFDRVNPDYAFTEMRAFARFTRRNGIIRKDLGDFFSPIGIWFDPLLCHDHGFNYKWADKLQRPIKDLYRSDKRIACDRGFSRYYFAAINCSWVSADVYQWIDESTSVDRSLEDSRLIKHLQFTPSQRLNLVLRQNLRRIKGSLSKKLSI